MARLTLFCFRILPLLLVLGLGACSRQSKIEKALRQGDGYLQAAKYEEAKLLYLSVLRFEPRNHQAIKGLGEIWFQQGVALEAVRYLKAASEHAPDDVEMRLKLAQSLATLSQVPAAREEAQAILTRQPSHARALLLLVQIARTLEEVAAAEPAVAQLKPDEALTLTTKAWMALHRKDLPAAEVLIARSLAVEPNLDETRLAKAALNLAKKDRAQALEEYRIASTVNPRSRATAAYAQMLGETDVTAADKYLEEASAKVRDYLPIWVMRARLALKEKKTKKALEYLKTVFQLDPYNFEACLLRGQILLTTGQTDGAIDEFKRLTTDPLYALLPQPWFELGRAYLAKGAPSQAMTALEQAVKIYPDYADALLLLGNIRVQQGKPEGVVEEMTALLEKQPNLLPAQLLLSQAYRSQGNFQEAERVLRAQLVMTPREPEPYLLLALTLLQQGKRAEAKTTLEAVHELDPRNLLVVYHLVELDLAEKQFERALARAEGLGKLLPNLPGPLYLAARVHVTQQHWIDAESALKKSIEFDQNFTAAYELLISIYVKSDRLLEARGQVEGFLAKNPENIGALQTLGLLQESLGDFDGARETYHRVIASNPDSPVALNNLAVIYATKLKQLDKAYEFASRSRNLRPEDGAIADTLGWIVYQRQDYPQAIALLQEAAERLPGAMEVQYHLGMAYYMSGQVDAAKAALSKAAASAEPFPGKDEIPQALAMIGGTEGSELSEAQLEVLVQQRPEDLVARQKLADRLEKSGQPERAAMLWEEALRRNQKLLVPCLKLAGLYAGPLRNRAKALEYAKKARVLAPEDPEASKLAGRAAYQSGDYVWAHSLLSESSLQAPKDAGLAVDLAWAEYSLGQVAEARKTMERALALSEEAGDQSRVKEIRRWLRLTATEVSEDFTKVLAEDPSYVPALVALGESLKMNRQDVAALDAFQKVLEQFPEFIPAQRRAAQLHFTVGETQKAYELAKVVRQKSPQDREILLLLGELSYARGEFAYTSQLFTELAQTQKLDARGLFLLGMSYWHEKNEAGMQESLTAAIAAGLGGSDLREAQDALSAQKR